MSTVQIVNNLCIVQRQLLKTVCSIGTILEFPLISQELLEGKQRSCVVELSKTGRVGMRKGRGKKGGRWEGGYSKARTHKAYL